MQVYNNNNNNNKMKLLHIYTNLNRSQDFYIQIPNNIKYKDNKFCYINYLKLFIRLNKKSTWNRKNIPTFLLLK